MNTSVPNFNSEAVMLRMNEVQPQKPDVQILFLCKKGQICNIPIDTILAQYKYCLMNNHEGRNTLEKAIKEICPQYLKEMEALYARK